jgi:3-phosphoshikimate 1-carboxyvinyltransferase
MLIKPRCNWNFNPRLPGDKSLSHRALIHAAIASGISKLENLNSGADVNSTKHILSRFEIQFNGDSNFLSVESAGMKNWTDPGNGPLDCGNSGTTARLLTGLLSGLPFTVMLDGDESLRKRPMNRVLNPLRTAGAEYLDQNMGRLPITILGNKLRSFHYTMPVPSAQVKSALIYAALNAGGKSVITEAIPTRDHTERLAKISNIRLYKRKTDIIVNPSKRLYSSILFKIPGDPSAAAFWLAAALICRDAKVLLSDISLNPTRIEMFRVLKSVGARIQFERTRSYPEPVGNIIVHSSRLKAFTIGKKQIPLLVDEVPLLALLASQANGTSILRHLSELKVKESDRLAAIEENLAFIGIETHRIKDNLIIEGPQNILGGTAKTYGDHRIAMMMAVAGLASQDGIEIPDPECAAISDPFFFEQVSTLV